MKKEEFLIGYISPELYVFCLAPESIVMTSGGNAEDPIDNGNEEGW